MRQGSDCYNACTMQVYVEYAILENFCMDFALLTAAKAATKNPARYLRIAFASAAGACFAVCFPLFGLSGGWAVAVKILSGVLLAAVAGKYASFKGFLKFAAVFAAMTFLTGGALIAIFSLADISYLEGGGYLISSVPVGIPLFAVVCLAAAIKKLAAKRKERGAVEAKCKIYYNGRCAVCKGFYDSGNRVYMDGAPVTVAPKHVALQLTDCGRIKSFAYVHTVAGESRIPVFTAEKIEIYDGKSVNVKRGVLIGVSPRHINKVVIHPDLSEAT